MPRSPRFTPSGTVQHFVSRYAGGEFRIRDEPERRELSRRLAAALRDTDWSALACAWMSNHEHLAALGGVCAAEAFLKPLHTGVARWLNDRDGRFGHVYAGRPRNVTFDTEESVATVIAYIHNNPVRAGLVTNPLDSTWTTHRAYVGEAPAPPWFDVQRGLSLCGFNASGNGRANFHDFVCARSGLPRDPILSGGGINEMRETIRTTLGPSVDLSPAVKGEHQAAILVPSTAVLRPGQPLEPLAFIAVIADLMKVPADALFSGARTRSIANARRVALLIWTRGWHQQAASLARVLGVTPQACSKLLKGCREDSSSWQLAKRLAAGIVERECPEYRTEKVD